MRHSTLGLLLTLVLMTVLVSCSQDENNSAGPAGTTVDPAETAALQYVAAHMDELQLRSGIDGVKVYRIQTDQYGDTHVRVDQTYYGLRVQSGTGIVHLDAELQPTSFSSGLIIGVETDVHNDISATTATAKALADFTSSGYVDHDVFTPELVVMRTGTGDLLCWSLVVRSQTQLGAREYFVDAHTGEIVTWLDLVIS